MNPASLGLKIIPYKMTELGSRVQFSGFQVLHIGGHSKLLDICKMWFLFIFSFVWCLPAYACAGVWFFNQVACFIASSHRKCGNPDARSIACVPLALVLILRSAVPFWSGESCTVSSWTVPFWSWCWIICLDWNSPPWSEQTTFMQFPVGFLCKPPPSYKN